MPMTNALPRRPTLMTIPALEKSVADARPSSSIAPTHAPQSQGKTGPFFYLILSFIILALILGIFPPA